MKTEKTSYQFSITPYVKITYDTRLNGDYELIFGWLKWELIFTIPQQIILSQQKTNRSSNR